MRNANICCLSIGDSNFHLIKLFFVQWTKSNVTIMKYKKILVFRKKKTTIVNKNCFEIMINLFNIEN